MSYLKRLRVELEEEAGDIYITDNAEEARALRSQGKAVLVYFHQENREQDFSDFIFAVEDPERLEQEYLEQVYRRLRGLPWKILETQRCVIRETTEEDVEPFYEIYSHPAITEFMEDLYPEKEQERAYIREYIEKVYTYYEFGIWTVVEKDSGAVIGRAGFSFREGYAEPELGFTIGVPWQRRGYAEEVCRAILNYGWEVLGFERVQVFVETENTASIKLCHKLGFRIAEENQMKDKNYFRMILLFG